MKIILVFKTHFDIGFTDLATRVIDSFHARMLPKVVQTCLETQSLGPSLHYVWTMPSWPLLQTLFPPIHAEPGTNGNRPVKEGEEADILETGRRLAMEGQIAWHALPFTTHTEACGLEDYIRGLLFSRTLSELFGRWPVSAKMTDVPGHTWILPTLLARAGIRFLHLGCNSSSTPPDVPPLFFWEGPDGSRVLTMYSSMGYGTPLVPPPDWTFPTWLALMQTNDNVGPQSASAIEGMIATIRQRLPDADIRTGTLDDFYGDMSRCDLSAIPVVRKDLADTWIHGAGSYPVETAMIRSARNRLTETEKLISIGSLTGRADDRTGRGERISLREAYEQAILFGEHTWGLDVKSTLGYGREYEKGRFMAQRDTEPYRRIEESWAEQRGYARAMQGVLDALAPEALDSLAAAMPVAGRRHVVANGCGWSRQAVVDLGPADPAGTGPLVEADTGVPVESWVESGHRMARVKDLPPLGYMTLAVRDPDGETGTTEGPPVGGTPGTEPIRHEEGDEGQAILSNPWLRVVVSGKRGGIVSLVDRRNGREWVDDTGDGVLGAYSYDIIGFGTITEFIRSYSYRFFDWSVNDYGRMGYPFDAADETFSAADFRLRTETGRDYVRATLTGELSGRSVEAFGNASRLRMTITLPQDEPYLDIRLDLSGKQATPMVEAAHLSFPFRMAAPRCRINKLGSIVDPASDIARNANHQLYCCEHWIDLEDESGGMTLLPLDTPLLSLGTKGIYKFRGNSVESAPKIHANLFNTSWGSNFPQWIEGDMSFRFRLVPRTEPFEAARVFRQALDTVLPVLAGSAPGQAVDGRAPGQKAALGQQAAPPLRVNLLDPVPGMAVLSLKQAEDRDGLILRLRDIEGREREVDLVCLVPGLQVQPVDLVERPVGDRQAGGRIRFVAAPFGLHGFRLTFGDRKGGAAE